MYGSYFHLERMPFENTADPAFFFGTQEHEEALAALLYGVTQRRGLMVVTGPPGAGKTLLAHLAMERLHPQTRTALLLHAPDSGHDLMTSLCRELGIRYRASHPTGELVERLRAYLREQLHEGKTVAAIVDEAQHLDVATFEYLRMLGQFEHENTRLLQIVLVGQPDLLARLSEPALQPVRQSVACSAQLRPLTCEQTHAYIVHRLTLAGAPRAELFTSDALDQIYVRSEGLARLINQIADNALLAAYSAGVQTVDRDIVDACMREMMAFHDPGGTASSPGAQGAVDPQPAGGPVGSTLPGLPCGMTDPSALVGSMQAASELTGRLREVSHEASHRMDDLRSLLDQVRHASDILKDHNASSVASETQLGQRDRWVQRILGEVERASMSLETNRQQAESLTQQLATLVNDGQACTAELQTLAPDIRSALHDELNAARTALQDAAGKFEQLNDANARADRAQREVHAVLDQLADVQRTLNDQLECAEHGRAAGEDAKRQMDELVAAYAHQLKHLEGSLPEMDGLCVRLDEARDAARTALGEYDGRIQSLKGLLAEVPAFEARLNEAQHRAVVIEHRTEAAADRARSDHEQIQEALAASEAHIHRFQTLLPEVRQAQQQLLEVKQTAEESLTCYDQQLSELAEHFVDLPGQLADLKATRDSARTLREALQSESSEASSRADQVRTFLKECEGRVEHLEAWMPQARGLAGELDHARDQASQSLAECTARMAEVAEQIEGIPGQLHELRRAGRWSQLLRRSLLTTTGDARAQVTRGREFAQQLGQQVNELQQMLTTAHGVCDELAGLHTRLRDTFTPETVRSLKVIGLRVKKALTQADSQCHGMTELVERLQRLQAELATSESQARDERSRLSQATVEARDQESQVQGTIEQCRRNAETLSQLIDTSAKSSEQLNQDCQTVRALHRATNEQLNGLTEATRQAEDGAERLTTVTQRAADMHEVVGRRVVNTVRTTARLQERLDAQHRLLTRQVRSAEELRGQLDALRQQLTVTFGPVFEARLEQHAEILSTRCAQAEQDKHAIDQAVTAASRTHRQIADETRQARITAEHLREATASGQSQERLVTELVGRIDAQQQAIDQRLQQATQMLSQMDAVQATLADEVLPATERRFDECQQQAQQIIESAATQSETLRVQVDAIEAFRKEFQDSFEQVAELREAAQQAAGLADQHVAALKDESQRAEAMLAEQSNVYESLQTQMEDQLRRLADRLAQTSSSTEAMLGKVQGQSQSLHGQLNEARAILTDLVSLQDEIQEAIGPEVLAQVGAQAEAVEQSIDRARCELANLEQTGAWSRAGREEIELAMARAAQRRDELAQADIAAQQTCDELNDARKQTADQIEAAEILAHRLDLQQHQLEAQSSEARATSTHLESVHVKLAESFSPEKVAQLESRSADIEKLIATACAQCAQLDRQTESVAALHEHILNAKAEVENLSSVAREVHDSASDDVHQLRDASQSARRDQQALTEGVTQARESLERITRERQRMDEASEQADDRLDRLTGGLQQAGAQFEQLASVLSQADTICQAMGEQTRSAQQVKRELDKIVRRLNRERVLALASADQLQALTADVQRGASLSWMEGVDDPVSGLFEAAGPAGDIVSGDALEALDQIAQAVDQPVARSPRRRTHRN